MGCDWAICQRLQLCMLVRHKGVPVRMEREIIAIIQDCSSYGWYTHGLHFMLLISTYVHYIYHSADV